MSNSKQVKCSVCGRPIKTAAGAVTMSTAPLVCRRCFGEQSYSAASQWVQHSNQGQTPGGN